MRHKIQKDTAMKKLHTKPSVIALILSLAFLPQFISYAARLFQAPETGWVVWETTAPVQRLAWDGASLWAGRYRGGLSQWNLEAGQTAGYTSADGLSGDHILSIAVDGSGGKWLAIQDGSLNYTTDGASFTDLTPSGIAGQNAWDLSVNGGEVWLATLGGGVSHYSNSGWTTYNKANSNLPFDDIYAIAANGGSPWVGTIGYGAANLQGNTWVRYTLPAQIPDPLKDGAFKSNQAVTDIALDSAGNKWFATDGSGVAVLDSSNANWTVYDTSNSGISSNFIQRIYIDAGGNYWFGTLGGGVSRLSSDLGSWGTFNTANSPLPEDDILDLTMDDQGGLWLASYDAGLTYYGPLPLTPPEFQLDLAGEPDYLPGKVKGYYLWVDTETFEWTLAWSGDGAPHTFTGEIAADAPFTIFEQTGMEAGDSANADGNSLVIDASEQYGEDAVTFRPALAATELNIHLMIDGAYYPYSIHIGGAAVTPATAPFRLAALQPQAPLVDAGEDLTLTEGEYVLLSAEVTDPDSPIGHTYKWDLGDGTTVTDTLFVDHIYKDEGTYTAQLTVTDVHGRSGTDSVAITVQNAAPSADFYYDPFAPNAGETITFTGSFYDPGELDTHTITWDFDDGSDPLITQDLVVTHVYHQVGLFEIKMTVTDNDGGVSTASATLEIVNEPPQFTLGEADPTDEGAAFTHTASFGDPDSTQWQLEVDFGDDTPPHVKTLDAEGEFSLNHVYADNGSYTVTASLTDDLGAQTTQQMTVTVQNVTPQLGPREDVTAVEGEPLVQELSIIDPGADTWSATIDYGDGTALQNLQLTSRSFELSHVYADNGTYTVQVCIKDDDDAEACESFPLVIQNANPRVTAGDDHEINEGETISVLAHYSDVGMVDTHTATIDWDDGNVENVPVSVSGAGSGAVSAEHTYKDNGEFKVKVCVVDDDGGKGCDILLVSASNLPPVFEAGSDQAAREGQAVNLPEAVFSDEGASDEHTATIDWGDGTVEAGSVEYTDEGAGKVSAAHRYGDEGTYTVSIELCDDDGACVQDGFEVTISNANPVVSVSGASINEGETAGLQAEFTDPGFLDVHSALVDWGDGSQAESLEVVESGGEGQVSASHAYGDNGSYTVKVTVTDDDGGEGSATAVIEVANLSPQLVVDTSAVVAMPDGDAFLARAGVPQEYQFTAADPGSDDLTLSWSFGLEQVYYNNALSPDPFPSPQGTYPFTVNDSAETTFSQAGIYTLSVDILDDDGGSDSVSLPRVIVIGEQACPSSTGFWKHQFNENGKPQINAQLLQAYLDILNVRSSFFSETVPVNTIDEGRLVMYPSKPDERERATLELLSAWLNYAQGSVNWDESIYLDKKSEPIPFWKLMTEAETILMNEAASKKDLDYAELLAKAVYKSAQDRPACLGKSK